MANAVSIKKIVGNAAKPRMASKKAAVGDPVPSFNFLDNQDGSFDIFGVNAAGNEVDILGVATLTPAPGSSDPGIVNVDPPTGMHVVCHGIKPGHADLNVTATFTDGSVGPFFITVPCDVAPGPATGLGVKFGEVTIRV